MSNNTQVNPILTVKNLTMSSVEIAALTGKSHKNVMRDIRKILDELNLEQLNFERTYLDVQNKAQPMFSLPKRECLILVSGYNVALRAKIIDRWQELEAQAKAAPAKHPAQLSRIEILEMALESEQKLVEANQQIEEMKPAVDALDRIARAKDSLCLRDAAKALQMRPTDLTDWLQKHEWIYKRVGVSNWLGYQVRIQTGLLEHKVTTVSRSDGSEKVVTQVRVTPKGLTRLGKLCAA